MEYSEFIRRLGKAGLTVREFGRLVGMNPNSISNYAKRPAVPNHIAVIVSLLAELAEHGIDCQRPLAGLGVHPKKARGVSFKVVHSQSGAGVEELKT